MKPTIGSLCTGYGGLGFSRTRELRILGNGVVPVQAYLALSLLW